MFIDVVDYRAPSWGVSAGGTPILADVHPMLGSGGIPCRGIPSHTHLQAVVYGEILCRGTPRCSGGGWELSCSLLVHGAILLQGISLACVCKQERGTPTGALVFPDPCLQICMQGNSFAGDFSSVHLQMQRRELSQRFPDPCLKIQALGNYRGGRVSLG